MILVVGLAIAGIVGIAAAFYFSIRSGRGGNKRLRSARAGRAGTDRRPGSRSGGTARSDRTDNARRAANGHRPANTGRGANASSRNYRADDSTGPIPVLDFGDPVLVAPHVAICGGDALRLRESQQRVAHAGALLARLMRRRSNEHWQRLIFMPIIVAIGCASASASQPRLMMSTRRSRA